MVDEVMRSIRMFRESGVTIFLVEQNANLALRLADRAYVMETGQITMTGRGAQLLADARVRASYLGAKTTSETGIARGQ
jgi:branched-chain amino acid transport system ATP-binding protein